MIKYFQNRFILSEKGAKDLQKGIALGYRSLSQSTVSIKPCITIEQFRQMCIVSCINVYNTISIKDTDHKSETT